MSPVDLAEFKSILPKNLEFGTTNTTIIFAELTNVEEVVLFELSLSFNNPVEVDIFTGDTYVSITKNSI